MWLKLCKAIQKIYKYFIAFLAKIKKVSPAEGYVDSQPKIPNPLLILKIRIGWGAYGIEYASYALIVFGGIIIVDTVIRFFTHPIRILSSSGINSVIDKCNKGAITTNILKLSDNILIAYTILFAGLLLFNLAQEWKSTEKKGDTPKFSVLIHGIDRAILSMVTIALSINFLIIVLINTNNNGTQGDTFYAGVNIACIIIAIAIYIYLTHTREGKIHTHKDETNAGKDETHPGIVSQENTDVPPDK